MLIILGNKPGQVSNLLPFFVQLGLLELPKKEQTESEQIGYEQTGPFRTWYNWNVLDFEYPTEEERYEALESGEFIPENNLPLGVEVYKDRLFVTMPKWKPGVPATLAVLPRIPEEPSPRLVPYPNWNYHRTSKSYSIPNY